MPLQLGCFLSFRRLTIYISPTNAVLPFFIIQLLLNPFVDQAGRGEQRGGGKKHFQKKKKKRAFQRSPVTHLSLYFIAPSLLIITETSLQLKEMKDYSQGLHECHQKTQTLLLLAHLSKHLTFETISTLLTELEQVAGGVRLIATFSCPSLRRVYTFATKPGTVYCPLNVHRNRAAQLNTGTVRDCKGTGFLKPTSQNRPSKAHYQQTYPWTALLAQWIFQSMFW